MKSESLGNICEINNGFAFKSSQYKRSGIPLLRISNFNDGKVYIDDKQIYLDEKFLEAKKEFIVTKGD
ncbi:MAG TPA: type I restriction endonuclease subunit S, partial [Xanthomarina gelatinilytica]|nr:type I restriction endonuclease subunit S [Xanthomarina gelatinilytica]